MRAVVQRLLALFHRDRLDRELDDEMQAHLELAERDARAAGLSPDEARLAARRAFGGLDQIREAHRDARSVRSIESLWRDVRYGLRAIRRTPAVCATIVLILAVGIGANTAVFSVTDAILLRPLEYGDADRLVVVMHGGRSPVSFANFDDWRRQNSSFSAMGAAEYWRPNVGFADGTERLLGLRVSPEMLPMLQVPPVYGRLLDRDQSATADERRVVISYGFWLRHFSGDPAAVGRTIRLDGDAYSIAGVMPPSFAFAPFWAVGAELWAPLPRAARTPNRGANSLRVFARLAPGVSVAQAQADLDALTSQLEAEFPGTNRNVRVVPLKERVVGDTRLAVLVFMIGVTFVLLIACANVAHMLLARAATRRREVAVRLALGATRLQIVRQFLVENLLLAGLGGLAGVGLATLGVPALVALAPPDLPRVADIRIDTTALLFTTAVSLAAGLVFGLVPALQSVRPALAENLSGRGTTSDRRQSRLRDLLIASEIALSLVLLAGAGLMVRSMASLQSIDPGFDPQRLLALSVSVHGTPHAEPSRRAPFFTELVDRLGAQPDVESVSAINHLPIEGDLWTRAFAIEGRPQARPGEGPGAAYRVVLPGYFGTMGIPLVRGRDFARQDAAGAPGVVIISGNLARRHWPGEDAVGKRIVVGQAVSDQSARWLTVVGITANAVRRTWEEPAGGELYLPYLQTADYLAGPESRYTYLTVVLRGRGEGVGTLMASARAAVLSLDRGASVSDVTTMEAVVGRALARPRFQLTLLALFAGVALLLAAVGVYGIVSYAVARRTREIGLRLALGAARGQVRRMVLAQSLRRVAIGAVVGLVGALGLTQLMSNLLHGVRPGDPATFVAVTALLGAVALLASYIPAWRASRIDPIGALREE